MSAHLLYKCRRCLQTIQEGPHVDVSTALRRALEHAPTVVHECPPGLPGSGGGFGIAEIIGSSERPGEAAA